MVGIAAGVTWLFSSYSVREMPAFDGAAGDLPVAAAPDPAFPPSAPPERIGPDGQIVDMPRWVRQPIPEYPVMAMKRGIESGSVVLRCEALASGDFGACEVLSEQPAGAGFAEAALLGVRDARIKPRSIDGFETDSTIQLTVRFRLEP